MLEAIVNFFTGIFQAIGRAVGFVLRPFMWVGDRLTRGGSPKPKAPVPQAPRRPVGSR
jgi:hypothetical protein